MDGRFQTPVEEQFYLQVLLGFWMPDPVHPTSASFLDQVLIQEKLDKLGELLAGRFDEKKFLEMISNS